MNVTIPHMIDLTALSDFELAGCLMTCVIAVVTAAVLGCYSATEFNGDKPRAVVAFSGITLAISLLYISFFGFAATALRGIIFSLALIYSSYSDIKTRECSDVPFIIIAVAAFIGCPLTFLTNMLLSTVAILLILLCGSLLSKAILNGADLKCCMACGFVLGMAKGILGMVIGLVIAITVNLILKKDRKSGFPLLPYLAVGFTAAYIF